MGAAQCSCKRADGADDADGAIPTVKSTTGLLIENAAPYPTTIDDVLGAENTEGNEEEFKELTEGSDVAGASVDGASVDEAKEALSGIPCTLTQEDANVGDHVCPAFGGESVESFVNRGVIVKLLEASGEDLGRTFSLDSRSISATQKGGTGGFACAVSDPTSTDCPLVFVSPGFEDLTGYSKQFSEGRSCRFLQPTQRVLNDAINLEERKIMREFCSFIHPNGTTVINLLLNQRFTGERFWNLLRMQHVVVDGECYIFAVQTNIEGFMPKLLAQSVKGTAKNANIVKSVAPFLDALSKLRKQLRTMISQPMMELKGYFTASLNFLQMLPSVTGAPQSIEKPLEIFTDGKADESSMLKQGETVQVLNTIKYPSFALAKGYKGKIAAMDSFGNAVVEWEDTKIGSKGVLKRDFNQLKVVSRDTGTEGTYHKDWQKLYDVLTDPTGSDKAEGVAASHSQNAREAAARKLITNHKKVIDDVTNPSRIKNIENKRLTQTHLSRVEHESKAYVDQMLLEVSRRLLGCRPGLSSLVRKPDKRNSSQGTAWRGCAIYMAGRIQSKPEQKPGRKPDMSEEAAACFLAVLQEVAALTCATNAEIKSLKANISNAQANTNEHPNWLKFYNMLADDPLGSQNAEGVASSHSYEARNEIAQKLINNHGAVIMDITNPSKTDNIHGNPLTQTHLVRVDPGSRLYVDQMFREVTRRLLGSRPGLASLEEKADKSNTEQCLAWRGSAIYLAGRIQSKPEQKPGREPDMSEEAAAAFLAVLEEVAALTIAKPADIKSLSESMSNAQANFAGDTTPKTTPRKKVKSKPHEKSL